MRLRAFVFLTATCGLLATSVAEGADAKAPELSRVAWYDFKFFGNKVGFMMARDEGTLVNGRPAYHLKRWSVVSVKRKAEVIRVESVTDVWVEVDGTPMRFKTERKEAGDARSVEGYRDGDVFVIKRAIGKNLDERRVPLGDLRLATSLDLYLYTALDVGRSWKGRALREEDGEIQDYEMKVRKVSGSGRARRYTVYSRIGRVEATGKVRPDGVMEHLQVVGIGAEYLLTDKDQAVQLSADLDIFSRGLFELPRPLPSGGSLERVVVRLSTKSGAPPPFVKDRRQKVLRKRKKWVDLELSVDPAPDKAVALPVTSEKVAAYLAETPYEPLKDEALVATTERVVADAKDVWTAARAINRFVYEHIRNKTLARAYATATEALATREGDCTEHATLFSALAKIAGIPTRHATGLVYVGGTDNVFGYHEWVEIWVGDRWLAMDPTFGQDIADPTHIKFAQGQTDAEGLQEAGLTAASVIGNLRLKVLRYQTTDGTKKNL